MPVSLPTVAVFDMGGVLMDWNPDYLYCKIIPDAGTRRHFFENICTREWHERHDEGTSFDENARELIEKHPEADVQDWILAWGERFDEMFGSPIQGTIDIVSDLHRRGVPLYGLTNWSDENFVHTRTQFPFFGLFSDIVVSGVEKVKKPDLRIYEILIERARRRPEEMVFIDDRDENLEPAAKLGFHTIRFTSPEALRVDLQRLKML